MQPQVLLITGTVASGKTSVALEIGEIMPSNGIPVAVVDIDWLGRAWLGSDHRSVEQLRLRNLAAVWPNYLAAGIMHFVLAHAVRSSEDVNAVREALPEADLRVFRLSVSSQAVTERLKRRDTGRVLEEHLEVAPAITTDLDRARIEDFLVSNEDRSIRESSSEILRLARWTSG
jgi:adenylylsulfate kinase-like enzyme